MIEKICNTQEVLFDVKPELMSLGEVNVPDTYEDGFALFENINNVDEAYKVLTKFISLVQKSDHITSRLKGDLQLAKADRIPVCQKVIDTSFQALHFDMGQPISKIMPQKIYAYTALYFPIDEESSSVVTRIVTLKKLLSQKKWSNVKSKLMNYAERYGDSWKEFNSGRIACFARFIDALNENTELIDFRDKYTSDWFKVEGDGNACRENEVAFYNRNGYDVDSVEKQINLKPGQLLIIDNINAVHGKVGQRKEAEVYQIMFGIDEATVNDVDLIRENLVDMFS